MMHQVDSLQATLIAELIYASYAVCDVCMHHLSGRTYAHMFCANFDLISRLAIAA